MDLPDNVLILLIVFAIGLTVLIKGSDWFIEGASKVAKYYDVPDIIIGLTLVSIGTSLPELATNLYAAYEGNVGVAMGNATGSNVANVLLVLGLSIFLMKKIPIDRVIFHRDTMIMGCVYILFIVLINLPLSGKAQLSRLDGFILFVMFFSYMFYLFQNMEKLKGEIDQDLIVEEKVESLTKPILVLLSGGLMVIGGAKFMVDAVVVFASSRGIPDEIISSTIIAFGTSVPELAITISGILKRKNDIALGNIIGSNIFNLVFVMGATAMITPIPVTESVSTLIMPYMIFSGALLVIFMRTGWALVRWEGILFLLGYISYLAVSVIYGIYNKN